MSPHEAFKKVCTYLHETPVMMSAREYDNAYGFYIGPKGSIRNERNFVGGTMFCVDKKSGKVFTSDDDEYDLRGKRWFPLFEEDMDIDPDSGIKHSEINMIIDIYGNIVPSDYLIHYGTPEHSGRYPYGSGERPYQHDGGGSKTSYKKAKKELKVARRKLKEAKSDYKRSKWYVKDKKSDLKLAKEATRDMKKAYSDAKKSGNTDKAEEYKKHLDYDKKNDTLGKSKRGLERAKHIEKLAKITLEEARESYDQAKVERAKQKALLKEGKKRIKEAERILRDRDAIFKEIRANQEKELYDSPEAVKLYKDYDKRMNQVIDSNPKLKSMVKNWDGDGGELSEAVRRVSKDKTLIDLDKKLVDRSRAIESKYDSQRHNINKSIITALDDKYSRKEIAKKLGVSESFVDRVLDEL